MKSLKDIKFKQAYDSDRDNLLKDFYIPAMSVGVSYKRLAGYFSSGILSAASRGIAEFINNNGIMQLIIGIDIPESDYEAMQNSAADPEYYVQKYLNMDIGEIEVFLKDKNTEALCWMLANHKIEIKFGLVTGRGIFHLKVGIITDNEGNSISFSGSDNETPGGWKNNIEEFKVFRGWAKNELDYFNQDEEKFDRFWSGKGIRVKIVNLPEAIKDKYGMTTENGKLAIYLSEEKENLENIAKNNHETEVLIFKQAIALGWDCPRAQVLVLFRDWKSLTFSVQTVGRIMRMPEPDTGHYKQEILNHGFVFTNLADIEIKEDMARNYVTIYTSQRTENYKPIKLESVYRLRQREKTRLSPKFINIFLDEAKAYNLEKKIETKGQKLELSLISDYEAEGVDKLANAEIKGEAKINTENEADLQKLYDFFVKNNLSPFYPEDRSIGRLKEAIYYFFRMRLGMEYTDRFAEIINIVLSPKNSQHFCNVIDSTKEKYITETQKREAELQKSADWELPEILNYGGNFTEFKTELSAMKPFYYDNKWKTEEAFIKFLEKSDQIEWWFKNGDRDATFFAVSYIENGEHHPFYVDFIVKYKDGGIGLFDTKSGRTIQYAREKSDGLQEYIKTSNKSGHELSGGIVSNTESTNFTGRWMVYKGNSTDLAQDNFSNWELLEI